MSAGKQKLPQFALIKQFLEQQISSGELSSGAKIPTEQSLADSFSVSRMTARRAVQELADMGMLTRTPGSGTFVAEPIKTVPMIAITNLVDAAKQSNTHSHRIISADAVQLAATKARLMGLMADTLVFQLNLLHLNNNRPIQWQQICVNRSLAPALLKQKMDKIDPNDYLQWVCTPTKSDYQVSSVLPSASQRRDLDLSHQDNTSCLSVERRDWVDESVLSISTMLHPAEQFYLGDPLKDVKI
ncbi:GntR family transcriptional regulator [Porticoccaceae bacterium]|jgi:GntR family histidine utilization transcriptional repressor|nr:GntR family transcriptional regulator [Porticoccaceae bacterium]MDA8898240.1 GntR family transcriptional regulator [Porticoccaceae bacterium]